LRRNNNGFSKLSAARSPANPAADFSSNEGAMGKVNFLLQ